MKKRLIQITAISLLFIACKKEEENKETPPSSLKGAFILNEGQFGKANGSITHYNTSTGVLAQTLYKSGNNSVGLGETVQNLAFSNDKAFIVVKGSGKIVVASDIDYKHVSEIALSYPIQIKFYDGQGYISNGKANGVVYKLDPATATITDSVSVEKTPNDLLLSNNNLYVINGEYYDGANFVNLVDSTISVVNPTTFKVDKKVKVGFKPKFLIEDKNGDTWVAVSGKGQWDTGGSTKPYLVKLGSDGEVVAEYEVGAAGDGIKALDLNEDGSSLIYLTGTGVYSFSISDFTSESLILGSFYGMNVNPNNGDIYVCDAKDYVVQGTTTIYDSKGIKQSDLTVGVVPNGVVFK